MENNNQQPFMYSEEQLMARLKFFIGICLALTLTGIVFVVLYSIIFVTQPLNAMSPIDQKFFELIIPIATFLTGTLSGIMLASGNKEAQEKALEAANKGWDRPVSTPPASNNPTGGFGFNASGSIGGTNFSFNKAPSAPSAYGSAPSGYEAAPAAAMGAAVGAVCMSAAGKPMPVQEEEPEL
jgi:H+/Cl- antiporter ClcA